MTKNKYLHKVKSNLSFVNLGLGPVKKFVGQVIDASDIVTFFFIVTKCISTLKHELNMSGFLFTLWYLDLTWLPFVFGWLSWIVFWILIRIGVLDFALKFKIITIRLSGWISVDKSIPWLVGQTRRLCYHWYMKGYICISFGLDLCWQRTLASYSWFYQTCHRSCRKGHLRQVAC